MNSEEINSILKQFYEGNKNIAYTKLKKIFNENKNNTKLRFNLAVIQQSLNLNNEARSNYKFLINSEQDIKSMFNLYLIEVKEERYLDALNLINKIIDKNNDHENIFEDKAFVLYKLKRYSESIAICKEKLEIKKDNINFLNILGLNYFANKDNKRSKEIFNKALLIDKNNISVLNSIGRIYHEERNSKKAEEYLLKAYNLKQDSYEIVNNLAGFYREESDYLKAVDYYNKALKINPDNPSIINNLAKTYFDIGDLDLAENYSLKALKLNENDGNIKKILSFIYLKKQNYKLGWSYFDGRLNLTDFVEKNTTINKLRKKLYTKNNIDVNSKILILREQGVGDEILYGTIYKDALKNLPNAKIECDKRLIDLFKNSFTKYKNSFVELGSISNNDNKLKSFDNVLYAGSLGKFFRRKKEDFKCDNYLIANENKIEKYRLYLKQFNKKINIGISWRSFKNRYSNEKSLSLYDFDKVLNSKDCNFFNLQYGDVDSEILEFTKKNNIEIITNKEIDLFNDLDSLAAFLKNIDLFITVSNSTAHLSGALGTNTILIKPSNHALFHYWNQPTNKTPWYKSVKIIDKDELKNINIAKEYVNFDN